MPARSRCRNSVRPSVTCVLCGETNQYTARILINTCKNCSFLLQHIRTYYRRYGPAGEVSLLCKKGMSLMCAGVSAMVCVTRAILIRRQLPQRVWSITVTIIMTHAACLFIVIIPKQHTTRKSNARIVSVKIQTISHSYTLLLTRS